MAKRKQPKMVRIEWVDSAGTQTAWMHKGETLGLEHCTSVGFIHQQTKDRVVLAQSLCSLQVGNPLSIPRVAITSMKELK